MKKIIRIDADKDVLTVNDALERLKANPNDPDPEIQNFKASIESFYENTARQMVPAIENARKFAMVSLASIPLAPMLSNVSVSSIGVPPPSLFTDISSDLQVANAHLLTLAEPMQSLAGTIAQIQAPMVYPALFSSLTLMPRVDLTVVPEYVPFEPERPKKTMSEELHEETNNLLKEMIRLKRDEPKIQGRAYYFDKASGTFIIKEVVWKSLNLNTERGNDGIAMLFISLIDYLESNGDINNDVYEVKVPMGKLMEKLKSKGGIDVTRTWIKNTKGNLKTKKIIPSKLENVILIGDYDSDTDGFYFGLKIPVEKLSD
jgi:hypothetical protein